MDNIKNKRIIFYYPAPFNRNASSASGIRPVKMYDAFVEAGYIVDKIVGYSKDRLLCFRKIRNNVNNGIRYEFVYGESTTMPTELSDPKHIPIHPFLDFRFFKFCRRNDISIGIFYRDIYWRFPEYKEKVSTVKRHIALFFYYFDLIQYRRYLNTLFLPSVNMSKYIPFTKEKQIFHDLPPGHDCDLTDELVVDNPLKLIYVGGIGSLNRLHMLFESLIDNKNIKLTVCTRKNEWTAVMNDYVNISLSNNIAIEHQSGDSLKLLYNDANLALLFMPIDDYKSFAVPFKLYEYIGYCLPIITSKGTFAGNIVEKLNIGWNIEYSKDSFENLLKYLSENLWEVKEKFENIRKIQHLHSWYQRVKTVENILTESREI